MKSEKRAVVEIHYKYGMEEKDQFVIKKNEYGWRIDTKKYGFQSNNKWFKDYL
ncbi:MAG: hypothetical protein N4A49_09580 [Marinifilaceae bacterium]|jgi:hypothetical protein|nr:hypothetical protein [Marinifilaceae bacterium]